MISDMGTLLWNEFSISMTIGDRERVPFVSHDHFVEEWESVGRILIRGLNQSPISLPFCSKNFYATVSLGTRFQIPFSLIHFQQIYHHWRKGLF